MKSYLLKLFDMWCEKMKRGGRMFVVVNYTGQVSAYRYYPLFVENSWLPAWHPNLFFHRAGDLRGSHEMLHTHPWNLMSILLRGSYSHIHHGKLDVCGAPNIILVKTPDLHAIHDVAENTVSLVLHGFKKVSSNENFYNTDPDKKYGNMVDGLPNSGVAILQWTPQLQIKIDRRKKAMSKLRQVSK